MCLPSLKLGMPKRSKPPGNSSFSNTVTSYPFRFNWFATVNPAGPLPITATFFPLRTGWIGCTYPSRNDGFHDSRLVLTDRDRFVAAKFQYAAFLRRGRGETRPVELRESTSVCSNT